jgi:hypothetical protein
MCFWATNALIHSFDNKNELINYLKSIQLGLVGLYELTPLPSHQSERPEVHLILIVVVGPFDLDTHLQ